MTFVKGTETDPKLPEGACDIVLALDVYHHFDYPDKMLAAIHKALKPDGKLVIVEYYKRQEAMPDGRALTHIRLGHAGCHQGNRGESVSFGRRKGTHSGQPVHADPDEEIGNRDEDVFANYDGRRRGVWVERAGGGPAA